MKNWKRLLALLLSLALTASLCACKDAGASPSESPNATGGDPSAQPSAGADASPAPSIDVDLTQDILAFSAGMSASDEVLTINGQTVTADFFLYFLSMDCSQTSMYVSLMGVTLEELAPDLLNDAVSITANQILLQQKAEELGCLPTDAQVEQAKANMMADGQENYELTKASYGLSDESMERMFLSDAYYSNLLNAVAPTATDVMLSSYVYQVKHILLKTVDDNRQPLPEDEAAGKKAQAEDILAQLQAAEDLPAKFDELMMAYSEDNPQNNPDGYTATLGQMVPEFEEASLALKPGEMSGLVKSEFGYHIILRGEVADLQSYAEEYRQYQLQQEINAMLDEAEIIRAPALDALDVVDFYSKYSAYQSAYMAANQPAGSAPVASDPLEPPASDGVG